MGVNRALRRAAARKAFKQDVKMSDLDKTFCNIAKEEATNKLITSITFTMMRAVCLVLTTFRFLRCIERSAKVDGNIKSC